MNKTLARALFKENFGQANHYLITSLIGLYVLRESDISTAPTVFRTSWNPKDKASSIARSRIFVLHSLLGWAVDSLDMYASILHRRPSYLQSPAISAEMDGAGRSVYKKVIALGDHFAVDASVMALMDVLITWRNNVFHELAENRIRRASSQALLQNGTEIEKDFRGLITVELEEKAHRGADLTFKEAASLASAAHKYVEHVDAAVLETLDVEKFCRDAIQQALDSRDKSDGFAAKYFGLDAARRRSFVRVWLENKFRAASVDGSIIAACAKLHRTVD